MVKESDGGVTDLGAVIIEAEGRASFGIEYGSVEEAAKEVEIDKILNNVAWSRTFFILIRFLDCVK